MRRIISVLAVAAVIMLAGMPAGAHQICDFLTGGGFIITTANGTHPADKGTFAIGGGCKQGGDDHGLFGHLEYHDHFTGLNVHWLTITAYADNGCFAPYCGPDPKTRQPRGSRLICGTARTSTPSGIAFGDVDWWVKATDNGEPGANDMFAITLSKAGVVVYTTYFPDPDATLGGTGPGGGNIQLHKPNPSTGFFPPFNSTTCPAFFARFP